MPMQALNKNSKKFCLVNIHVTMAIDKKENFEGNANNNNHETKFLPVLPFVIRSCGK